MEKTLQNLAAAFIGESMARNRYTIYAKSAEKEGFIQLAAIFLDTADQEREHAKWLMRMINNIQDKQGKGREEIKVAEAGVPTAIGTTVENLKAAIGGENYEHSTMYPEFAEQAAADGLPEVAARLKMIAKAEAHHEERYKKLLATVESGSVFKKDEELTWVCRKCGYVHTGKEAPGVCPSCGHPQGYFQVKCEEF